MAMVFFVFAVQHGAQAGFKITQRNVGDETQPPLVDAHQRHFVARQLPANAQHGAIASHDQGQIAVGAYGGHVQHMVVGEPGVARGVVLQNHFAAFVVQKVGNALNGVARANRVVFAHNGHMLEAQRLA
jgi:hypothetical protein